MEARQVAVLGFLLILKNFKILGGFSCSQSSQSSYGSCSQVITLIYSQLLVWITRRFDSLPGPGGHTPTVHCQQQWSSVFGDHRQFEKMSVAAGWRPNDSLSGNVHHFSSFVICWASISTVFWQGLNDVLGKNQQLCRPVLSVLLSQVSEHCNYTSIILFTVSISFLVEAILWCERWCQSSCWLVKVYLHSRKQYSCGWAPGQLFALSVFHTLCSITYLVLPVVIPVSPAELSVPVLDYSIPEWWRRW